MPHKDIETRREYQRQWTANRRADFFKDKCCVQCGSTDRMELDHIDRSTKVNHRIWNWAEPRRLEEIAKCQVLCYSCHTDKSNSERPRGEGMGRAAKLVEEQVVQIKHMYFVEGKPTGDIAPHFGVTKENIWRIVNGYSWKHVPNPTKEDCQSQVMAPIANRRGS